MQIFEEEKEKRTRRKSFSFLDGKSENQRVKSCLMNFVEIDADRMFLLIASFQLFFARRQNFEQFVENVLQIFHDFGRAFDDVRRQSQVDGSLIVRTDSAEMIDKFLQKLE